MVVLKIFNALIQAATCTLLNHYNEVKNWAIYVQLYMAMTYIYM